MDFKKLAVTACLSLTVTLTPGCTGKVDITNPVINGGGISSPSSSTPSLKITQVNPQTGTFKVQGNEQEMKPDSPEVEQAIKNGEITEGDTFMITDSKDLIIDSKGKIFNFKSVKIANCTNCRIS